MAQMVESPCQFNFWLKNKLIELKTDDEIYCPYIRGILDSDDCIEEKQEGLEGILVELIDASQDLESICTEIIKEWNLYIISREAKKKENEVVINVDEKLIELMQQTKLKVTKSCKKKDIVPMNSEQKKLKEAILAQYAVVSSGESDEESTETASGFAKNTNAEAVLQADKDKREKDKEDSHKKKEKDKEDRAKQKSKDEDRKEKEKKRTQKGEKRR